MSDMIVYLSTNLGVVLLTGLCCHLEGSIGLGGPEGVVWGKGEVLWSGQSIHLLLLYLRKLLGNLLVVATERSEYGKAACFW